MALTQTIGARPVRLALPSSLPLVASRRSLSFTTLAPRSPMPPQRLADAVARRHAAAPRAPARRPLSTKPPTAEGGGGGGAAAGAEEAASEETALMLTPAQKVAAAGWMTIYAGGAALAAVCAYLMGTYLIPTRMSPNGAFNAALDVVRADDKIEQRYGEPLKGYGRDHGTRNVGRRNFIESTEYSEKDGSKRLRIRFTVEGPGNAKGHVYAELSDKMPSDEWVYIMVQDTRTGAVDNLIDNRMRLQSMMNAKSDAERKALSGLLGGGGGGSSGGF